MTICGPCGSQAVIQIDVTHGEDYIDGMCARCAITWCSMEDLMAWWRGITMLRRVK